MTTSAKYMIANDNHEASNEPAELLSRKAIILIDYSIYSLSALFSCSLYALTFYGAASLVS